MIVEKRSHCRGSKLLPSSEELDSSKSLSSLREHRSAPWLGLQLSWHNLPAAKNGGQGTSTSIDAVRQKPRAGSTFYFKKVFSV